MEEVLLQLVRLGIGNASVIRMPEDVNWEVLQALAVDQGLSAVVVDGLERLQSAQKPPKPVLLQWIGEVLQGYEYRYELYRRSIAEMAAFYNVHGFKMMVLKGYACSLDWPKPEHRPCGDIDIWQFGQQKEADDVLVKEKRIEIDKSHHHHTVFYWRDFMVENHYDFINVHHHKSHKEFEKLLKQLGADDSHSVEIYGEKVYLPSPDLHALFLMKHAAIEFAATGLNIRQVLDWAFFVKANGKDVDWEWQEEVLDRFGMKSFYSIINAICVENLGFEASIFNEVEYDPFLKERVLNEIVCPQIPNEKPDGVLPRVLWKIRRWKANEWKHKLCYKESMWSAFWSGVWNHILKPSSI